MHPLRILSAALLACLAAPVLSRPAVVELFTSEGCSSCPPAEAYVGELARRANVLALAYHVDYWDELGWRDRFELPEAVQRQRLYAKSLRLATIYTPQIVLDGRGDFVGSDRAKIAAALAQSRTGVGVDVAVRDGDIQIDLAASGGPADAVAQAGAYPSDVLLVSYQRSAVSNIGRGENAGRTLAEFNIVRSIRSLGTYTGRLQQYHAAVKTLPGDATDVAVLVQSVGQNAIIGAAAHSLH
jgi:hypothetical protein